MAAGGDLETGFGNISCLPNNQNGPEEGTSLAAPHVTGLAGLLKNLNEELTNVDIKNIMVSTAFEFNDEGLDRYLGYGMINALGAITYALGEVVISTEIQVENAFKFYPNPASDRLFVDKNMDMNKGVFEVFEITGRQIIGVPVGNLKSTEIDVQSFNNGVYILRMRSDKGFVPARFIKS